MRIFFVGPRQAAGIHFLIFFFNEFNKPHKGFRLRRTGRTPQPETRGERSPAEKRPFMDGH